ncbi:MAG: hypothetical protein R2911_11705 [Caldilineaceae bacterium]
MRQCLRQNAHRRRRRNGQHHAIVRAFAAAHVQLDLLRAQAERLDRFTGVRTLSCWASLSQGASMPPAT